MGIYYTGYSKPSVFCGRDSISNGRRRRKRDSKISIDGIHVLKTPSSRKQECRDTGRDVIRERQHQRRVMEASDRESQGRARGRHVDME